MARTATARKTATKALPAQKPQRFILIDGTKHVRDLHTGLEWSHTLGRATFTDAPKLIEKLNAQKHGGHADWRLPTVEELFLLADRSKYSPAIDKEAFPDTKSDWYWTSTPYAPGPGCAWFVGFGYGGSGGVRHVSGGAFLRAVRASQ